MKSHVVEIQQALTKYDLSISQEEVCKFLDDLHLAQQYFPLIEQRALMIKLLSEWESRRDEKIIEVTSEACRIQGGVCVTTFGILSVDWPGLFDSCAGVVHEMGWNIYFIKGISLNRQNENLGVVLIGVKTDEDQSHGKLREQSKTILSKIHQSALGTRAKTVLLSEEIRKLEIYSLVIAHIEQMYHGKDLEQIIGMDGEAVKYFAARSRDYIENRHVKDIAGQIIRNYTFIKKAHETGKTIQLHIENFKTKKEGEFTGITLAGPAHLLHLDDCLKTIELTVPHFLLKHNREFTTMHGISLFRIEFVDSSRHPLSELEQKRLRKAFDTMVLNKRRDRAQWIESIGGFEQYARAIIPLLVREAQHTKKTQVYHSVGHITDLFIDFKVIVVVPESKEPRKKIVSNTVNQLEAVSGFHVHTVRPPKKFGETTVFIIDLRVTLTETENTESIYKTIKERVFTALGEFRDFDEGMRTIDTAKLKAVRQRLEGVDKHLIRELYYGIEDFYRVSASVDEIIDHIQIGIEMFEAIDKDESVLQILDRQTGTISKDGKLLPTATLLCFSYPHQLSLLKKIIDILEPYEVTLSRLERTGRDILICRITKNEKALTQDHLNRIIKHIQKLIKTNKAKNP
jgi:hypothetical protein